MLRAFTASRSAPKSARRAGLVGVLTSWLRPLCQFPGWSGGGWDGRRGRCRALRCARRHCAPTGAAAPGRAADGVAAGAEVAGGGAGDVVDGTHVSSRAAKSMMCSWVSGWQWVQARSPSARRRRASSRLTGRRREPIMWQVPAWTWTGGLAVPMPTSTTHSGGRGRFLRPCSASASRRSSKAILRSMRFSHRACHTRRVRSRSRSGGRSSNTFLILGST